MICKSCNKDKPESAFSRKEECISGYDTSRCKACKKSAFDWHQTPIEKRIFNRTKARAKRNGIGFTITLEDIILPDMCPVFKKPFIYGDVNWTYSIDRTDNENGYHPGNVVIMSNLANRLKNSASADDLQKVVDYLRACEIDFDQLGKE